MSGTSASAAIMRAEELGFRHTPAHPTLDACSIAFAAGRLTCLLGPNGAGKTTLLRCLLGFLRPASGRIVLLGRELGGYSPRERARLLAYVPQGALPVQAYTAYEVVLMGRAAHTGLLGLTGPEDHRAVDEALDLAGAWSLRDRFLHELSGGEKQCVMLARALAQQPRALLLDEPTSALDVRNQFLMGNMLHRIAHERGVAVVWVVHDVNQALRHADDMALLSAGRLVAAGPRQDVATCAQLERVYGIRLEPLQAPDGTLAGVRALADDGTP